MALQYPDVSHYQAGLSLKGAPVVSAKATEGSTYRDPSYANFRDQATALGILFVPYHYLRAGSGARQAEFCYSVAGHDGALMLDVEANSGGVADVLAFVGRYRQLGGVVRLVYLPRWYWLQIGSPDLRPLAVARLLLVSSRYTSYADDGPGWAAYGGMTPTIWQYTDAHSFNGKAVDFNAFRGSIDQLRALLTGGVPTGDDMYEQYDRDRLDYLTGALQGDGKTPGLVAEVAAIRTSESASLAAIQALAAQINAAGGDIDVAPVLAAIQAARDDTHAVVVGLQQQIVALQGKLAAAEKAAADALAGG